MRAHSARAHVQWGAQLGWHWIPMTRGQAHPVERRTQWTEAPPGRRPGGSSGSAGPPVMGRGHTTCTVPCQTSTRRPEGGYERQRTSSGRLAGSSVFFTWLYALKSGWMQNTKHCRIALITVPQPTRMGSHKSIAQHNVAALSAHTRQGESTSTGWAHQACAHVQHEERGPAIGRVHEPEIATHFVLHLLPPKFEGHDHKAEASAERTRSPVKVSCGLGRWRFERRARTQCKSPSR